MIIAKGDLEKYRCVVRAHRLAQWANHAWGNLDQEDITEVWNVCPSLEAFAMFLPGYAVAKGWVEEGPAGFGVVGPECEAGHLVVYVGSYNQVEARFWPERSIIRYRHYRRWAEVRVEWDGWKGQEIVQGVKAKPRDFARVARLTIVAHQFPDADAAQIRDACRAMVGDDPEELREFDGYFQITGPGILAGPEVFQPTAP